MTHHANTHCSGSAASIHTISAEAAAGPNPPLYARRVADLLFDYLERAGTSVHWVLPAGTETSWGPPKVIWPEKAELGFTIAQGNNEGSKLTIWHLPEKTPELATKLLWIKFLRGPRAASADAMIAMNWLLYDLDVAKLRQNPGN